MQKVSATSQRRNNNKKADDDVADMAHEEEDEEENEGDEQYEQPPSISSHVGDDYDISEHESNAAVASNLLPNFNEQAASQVKPKKQAASPASTQKLTTTGTAALEQKAESISSSSSSSSSSSGSGSGSGSSRAGVGGIALTPAKDSSSSLASLPPSAEVEQLKKTLRKKNQVSVVVLW